MAGAHQPYKEDFAGTFLAKADAFFCLLLAFLPEVHRVELRWTLHLLQAKNINPERLCNQDLVINSPRYFTHHCLLNLNPQKSPKKTEKIMSLAVGAVIACVVAAFTLTFVGYFFQPPV